MSEKSKQYKELVKPVLSNQTVQQLDQIKNFVDESIKSVMTKEFNSQDEKVQELYQALNSVRSYALSLTHENSVRVALIKKFSEIDAKDNVGN